MKLYRGDKPTLMYFVLCWCARPQGFKPPYYKHQRFGPGRYHTMCTLWVDAGFVETRRSGPRKGRRWHVTDKGKMVLDILNNHPCPYTAFALLGWHGLVTKKYNSYFRR